MMAMASASSAGSATALACCQRVGTRQQLCFPPLPRGFCFFPLPIPWRGGVRLLPTGSSASRRRAAGRGVRWKERAVAEAASGASPLVHRRGGLTTAAAMVNGGSRESLPPEAVTFSANISTDLPLYDSPEASFDEYLDDRPRIFAAMFPDRRRCRRLNDEEWRVQMLPIQFLFASVNPVVVMQLRSRSQGDRCPSELPPHASRVLELRATRWELQGLEGALVPSHFVLDVRGLLYTDRGAGGAAVPGRSRLRGHLETSISLVLPPVFAVVPEHIFRGVAEAVLRRLVERMKREVDGSLLADFQSFRRERLKKQLIKKGEAQQPPVQC